VRHWLHGGDGRIWTGEGNLIPRLSPGDFGDQIEFNVICARGGDEEAVLPAELRSGDARLIEIKHRNIAFK